MKVSERWLIACSRLEAAAAEFYDACLALRSEAMPTLESRSLDPQLEQVVSDVQNRMGVISSTGARLCNSEYLLNSLLNGSRKRVPIHRLPTEIIGAVFNIVQSSKKRDQQCNPINKICLVCTRWREIAIGAPLLWSSTDINLPRHPSEGFYSALIERVERYVERSRGRPIHLYVRDERYHEEPHFDSELVSILQSGVTSLAGLTIPKFNNMDFVNALVSMASAHTSLELLRLSPTIGVADAGTAIRWPLDSWRKLTELTLSGLVNFGCPSSYELGNTLANCPGLHTLRINNIDPFWEQDREHPTIHLPSLKLFVISDQRKPGLLHLLTLMSFGDQSIDFRLFSRTRSPRFELESLLRRSNVEALTINGTKRRRVEALRSYLLCVPRLRVLLISSRISPTWVLNRLATFTDFDLRKHLPLLRSVCLMNGFIRPECLARTEAFLANNALRDLVFIGCDFFYPTNTSDTGIQADGNEEDGGGDSDEESDITNGIYTACVNEVGSRSGVYPMAESTRVELLQTFERVLVLDARPGCIHKGEDTFIRALVNAE